MNRSTEGYTFIELLVVSTILLILASAVAPLAQVTMQRQREMDLRRALREMRTAIDGYKDAVDLGVIGGTEIDPENQGYPPSLETLVEGVEPIDENSGSVLRFLRRIPIDPMTKSTDWGLRSYQDDPDATRWGGKQRLRRLHEVAGHSARRHSLPGMVTRCEAGGARRAGRSSS